MTAMLIDSQAQAELAPKSSNGFTELTAEYRDQAARQLKEAEPGSFVTYTEDCVERPAMKAFWYSQEYGWQDPEASGVPICFKDFDGQIVFGLFLVTGIERPERLVHSFAGEAQPPRCWFVKGSFSLEDRPEKIKVKGMFIPHAFSGEVMLDRANL